MSKYLLCLGILFSLVSSVYAEDAVITQQPYFMPYYPQYNQSQYRHNLEDMSALEKYALNRIYPRESMLHRLQRLESNTFGTVQQGDFNTRFENVRTAILSRPKQNFKTSVLRSIGDYFNGQITGFTPPIQDYYNVPNSNYTYYPSTYGNSINMGYSNPWGHRYRYNNYGTGNSSGVRIMY